jgi:hypothetical protein
MIKCAYINILETSNVSLSAGTEDASYPLYRLYDRNIGKVFKPASAETIEIKIDQGDTALLSADRLLIPSGHNLEGMTLDIMYSDDDVTYTPAVPQWTGASGVIDKSWSPVTKRYWKFIITNPASIPEITELFLTQTYEWERNPSRPAGPFDSVFNVENDMTAGGQDRFLVHGDPKRQRVYHVLLAGEAQKNNILDLYDRWRGYAPFFLYDHEGNWIFGKLRSPLNLKEEAYQRYSFDFDFQEVLP